MSLIIRKIILEPNYGLYNFSLNKLNVNHVKRNMNNNPEIFPETS